MELDWSTLRHCALFNQLSFQHSEEAIAGLKPQYTSVVKEECVLQGDVSTPRLGILLTGLLQIEKINRWGYRSILTQIEPGEVFAEAFVCANYETIPVSVIAKKDSAIAWIEYDFLITCTNDNPYHTQIILNLNKILANKALGLTQRMEHLTQPTTREKLMSYLSCQSDKAHSLSFSIPFNRQQLADYLVVERSAMCTALHLLQKEGLLLCHKNQFELLVK